MWCRLDVFQTKMCRTGSTWIKGKQLSCIGNFTNCNKLQNMQSVGKLFLLHFGFSLIWWSSPWGTINREQVEIICWMLQVWILLPLKTINGWTFGLHCNKVMLYRHNIFHNKFYNCWVGRLLLIFTLVHY